MNEERINRCIRRLYRALDSMEGLSSEGMEGALKLARDGDATGFTLGDYYRYSMISINKRKFRVAVKHLEELIKGA